MSSTPGSGLTPAQLAALQAFEQSSSTIGGVGTGSTSTQGILPASKAAEEITFTLPHQKPPFVVPTAVGPGEPSGVTGTKGGGSQMTFGDFMGVLLKLTNDRSELSQLQSQLFNGGYYANKGWADYGHLDQATVTAWEHLGEQAINGAQYGISVGTLLQYGNGAAGQMLGEMQAIQQKINTAREQAATVQAPILNLTDPNKVAESFQSAMEALGMGAPTQEQTDQFVNSFINGPQGEIAAEQNAYTAQKQDYLSGVGDLQQQLADLRSGNLKSANQSITEAGGIQAETGVGPVSVATKAMPNLDAEAIAAAEKSNPGEYIATGASQLYGLLDQMLGGSFSYQTKPSVPSISAPAGMPVTTPISGAV